MIPVVALVLDGAALAVLMLVPLAGPLGLADLEIPASAVLGWFMIATPLALAAIALLGEVTNRADRLSPTILQWAFVTCFCGLVLSVYMWIGADTPELGDAARMRGFSMVSVSIFAIDLLALWRPFVASISRIPRGTRTKRSTRRA